MQIKRRRCCFYCGHSDTALAVCKERPALLAGEPVYLCPGCVYVRTVWSVFRVGIPDWDTREEAEQWLRAQGGIIIETWVDAVGDAFDEYYGGTIVKTKEDKVLVHYTWDEGANWRVSDGTCHTLGRAYIHVQRGDHKFE